MAFFKFNNIRVAGIACAVPKNEVKTEAYKPLFGDEEVEKFMQMTGVRASHRTLEHQTCSDLGFRAAQELLAHKGIHPEEIGALIFSSHSPDYRRPSTAFVLQYRLGIPKDAVCYDISLGCSSLVVGMQTVASIMNSGDIKKALLFVGDTAGKSVYPEDRSSAMLFGEAGAVMLLEKTDDEKDEINALVRSDGSGFRYMIIPGGGYRNLHASEDVVMCKDGNPRTGSVSYGDVGRIANGETKTVTLPVAAVQALADGDAAGLMLWPDDTGLLPGYEYSANYAWFESTKGAAPKLTVTYQ